MGRRGGRASLATVPHCGPTHTTWFSMELGEKGEGSSADWGCTCWKEAMVEEKQMEFRSNL